MEPLTSTSSATDGGLRAKAKTEETAMSSEASATSDSTSFDGHSSGHSSSHHDDSATNNKADDDAVPEQFHDEDAQDASDHDALCASSHSTSNNNNNNSSSYNPMFEDSRMSVASSQDYSSYVGYVMDDHDRPADDTTGMDVSYSGQDLTNNRKRIEIEQQLNTTTTTTTSNSSRRRSQQQQQLEADVRAKQRGMRHAAAASGGGPPSTRRSSAGHYATRRSSAGHGATVPSTSSSRKASSGGQHRRRSSGGGHHHHHQNSSKRNSSSSYQEKQDMIAKQRSSRPRDRSSRPLNQMEQDLLAKQDIMSSSNRDRASLPQPGAVAVSGDDYHRSMVPRRGSGRQLTKDRSRRSVGTVSGGTKLDQMERALLTKDQVSNTTTSSGSNRRMGEESRKRSGSSRRLKDDNRKQSGSSRRLVTSGSGRRLSVARMEDDMLSKGRASHSYASSSRRENKTKHGAVASDLSQVADTKYRSNRAHGSRRSSSSNHNSNGDDRNFKDRSSSRRSSSRSDYDKKPPAKLVEARPVKEEDDLPMIDAHMAIAHADGVVDLEEQQRNEDRQAETKKQRQLWTYKVVTFGCLCLVAVIVGAYFIVSSGKEDQVQVATSLPRPTEPTSAPSSAPTPFLIDLPSACIEKIIRDSESPQGLAYRWMVNDPNIHQYVGEEWRILQRFALATIYYALDGPNWYLQNGWMDYDTNECDWSFKGGYGLPAMEMRGLVVPQLVSMIVGGAVTGEPFDWSEFVYVADRPTWPPAPICNPNNEMKLLKIHKNNVKGEIPDEIALLKTLALMDISYNEGLIGTLPTTLGKMKQMKYIMMEETGITGSIPSEIGEMSCMRVLSTSGTRFSKGTTIPTEIANMKELTALLIGFSGVEGTIPSEMGTMAGNLTILDLSSRSYDEDTIVGTIPSEIGLLKDLHVFSCGSCNVEGMLPSELGALHELELLSVGPSTNMTGSIPTYFGGMTSLKYAQLSKSQLSGPIPSELGLATDLVRMYLMENQLTGSLPSELGKMSSLASISLNGNEGLAGTIPPEVVDGWTEALESLNISDTRLTGEVFLFNVSA